MRGRTCQASVWVIFSSALKKSHSQHLGGSLVKRLTSAQVLTSQFASSIPHPMSLSPASGEREPCFA